MWKLISIGILIAASVLAASRGVASSEPDGRRSDLRSFDHLFVIMMENTSYETLTGNPAAPWINAAAAKYGVATRYYGVSHPSQPNYLAATSGSTNGVATNHDVTLKVRNLVDQLEASGKSWKDYQQSLSLCDGNKLSSICGDRLYVRKHNPFVSYLNVQMNPARMANVVDLSELDADLRSGRAADFSWISPDQCHDMHGRSAPKQDPCSDDNRRQLISAGDAFLKDWVGKIMASKAWTGNSVIFIVWDEGDSSSKEPPRGCCGADPGGGHVMMLVIRHSESAPRRSDRIYNHYSLLATIQDGWRLGCLVETCDAKVRRMSDLLDGPP
ncbi:MAG TPA: alkaline phosphatase family protein [Candidatus Manganitrophaceae bacterium]|nr:alkaline phosphatase family protein [Candidatus Manganitrophaceae bacterium]